VLTLLALIAFHAPTLASAGECNGNCAPLLTSLSHKENELTRIKDILRKNEEYLQKKAPLPTSISVKVRSNIVISKLQIETIENERTAINQTLEKQGCKKCKIRNTKDI
jgi:hypothetical protein